MAGTTRARAIVHLVAIIVLAGCGSGGGGGGNGGGGDDTDAGGASATISAELAWADASGPVAGYRVFVSRDGGPLISNGDVSSASATITGEPGDRVRVQVAALDAMGVAGPLSPPSAEILFTEDGVTIGAAATDSSTLAGSAAAGLSNSGVEDASEASDANDPTHDFRDGASPLLWERDVPSLALHLTSLWDDALRTDLSFDRPGDDWWVVGGADFDGDGLTDLLWESGEGVLAYSSLATLLATAPAVPLHLLGTLGVDESVISTGDFDGDGLSDLLVEDDASGERLVWRIREAGVELQELDAPDVAASSLAASGDFDGDGRCDLLWRAPDGALTVRFMDGHVAVAGLDLASGAATQTLAAGDVDGDGDDDLVIRDAAGAVGVLLMQAGQAPEPWNRAVDAGPGWELAGLGDFDGDGAADLLWASETDWVIGFSAPDSETDYVSLDPGADWVLVSLDL